MHRIEDPSDLNYRELFQGLKHQLAVWSALEGCSSARLYVDDPGQARSACLVAGRRHFLAGEIRNSRFNTDLRALYFHELVPQSQSVGMGMLEWKTDSLAWESVLKTFLKDQEIRRAERQYYRFRAHPLGRPAPLPDGFRLAFIDAAFIERADLKNLDALKEEMVSERASLVDFLEKSFGVCALFEDEVAAFCTSEYNCGERCEVGINTLPGYQRRGLATALVGALIEHALELGIYQIGWHCFAGNLPSVRTALKSGFEKISDYTTFWTGFGDYQSNTPSRSSSGTSNTLL
jgi:RimJ/RimL family protein N-acetyltransferase